MLRSLLAALVALALSPACTVGNVPSNALPMVRSRATSDLECADSEVQVEEQLGGRFQAIGCGRKAYYRAACEGLRCVVHDEGEAIVPWRDRPEPIATER
ncbi:hypothetical protein [Sorangium cellulosum]|uniref:hypothetical protein n=1 Tax=Sorangium cellulosum TaxID=56 RepID=UPI001F5D7F69|nr:hypothetical protein [Sorangium cellulosum]